MKLPPMVPPLRAVEPAGGEAALLEVSSLSRTGTDRRVRVLQACGDRPLIAELPLPLALRLCVALHCSRWTFVPLDVERPIGREEFH